MRKYFIYLKLLIRLLKTNRSDILLANPAEQDLKDLAFGRWHTFKLWFCPEFVIKLSRDDESLLTQLCLHQAYKNRTGGILSTFRPTGADYVAATSLMINYCHQCHAAGQRMCDFLSTLQEQK